jgi:hypothetical protein
MLIAPISHKRVVFTFTLTSSSVFENVSPAEKCTFQFAYLTEEDRSI